MCAQVRETQTQAQAPARTTHNECDIRYTYPFKSRFTESPLRQNYYHALHREIPFIETFITCAYELFVLCFGFSFFRSGFSLVRK